MTITIEITGIDAAIRKLGKIEGLKQLEPAMRDAVALIQGAITKYPAPPPNSTYRRTWTLGRSWTTKVTRSPLLGQVGTALGKEGPGYARYVQDRDMQAWMHVGRWQTIQDVAEKLADQVQAIFDRAINRLLA